MKGKTPSIITLLTQCVPLGRTRQLLRLARRSRRTPVGSPLHEHPLALFPLAMIAVRGRGGKAGRGQWALGKVVVGATPSLPGCPLPAYSRPLPAHSRPLPAPLGSSYRSPY